VITHSIDIDRPPAEVFAYLDELERHGEWQDGIVSAKVQGDGPVAVGTQVQETRSISGRDQDTSYEITEHEPPHRSSFKGTTGPVRPVGTMIVEPLDDGSRSRVTVELDLIGHGMGTLLAPFARQQASKEIPKAQAQLKARLESGV
jgi:uncharacterized membrane protein